MLRQLIVVFGTLTNGSVLSFMALQMLPVEMGLIAGILIFGAVLCILGIYVAQNDKKRQHLRR